MGEIKDYWKTLSPTKKIGYTFSGILFVSYLSLYYYNQRKYFYDPSKKKIKVSKWD